MNVTMSVNGNAVSADVEERTLLVEMLREHLGLTGTHVGCDTGDPIATGGDTLHLQED